MTSQAAHFNEDKFEVAPHFGEPVTLLLEASQKPKSKSEVSLLVRSLEERIIRFPLPGKGQTWQRWQALTALGAFDLSVAKLLESHFDALAIMAEAEFTPKTGVYGVWASKFEGKHLKGDLVSGGWHVYGDLAFASGIDTIEYSLVPVQTVDGEQMMEIPKSAITSIDRKRWNTPGMREADTAWITVDAFIPESSLVGDVGFYLTRRGFWPGAIGVAACWLGGAQALFADWLEASRQKKYSDPHDQAYRAKSYCSLKACSTYLKSLTAIVDDPSISVDILKREALTFRHLVDQASSDLLSESLRASGPVMMVKDAEHSKRFLDLQIFLRQCHAEKDLVNLSKDLDLTEFQGEWF